MKRLIAGNRRELVNRAVDRFDGLSMPSRLGWLRTVRTALGMSGVQLARRLGVSKASVSRAERDEPSGRVTRRTIRAMAETMDCWLVYAVVPRQHVEDIIRRRALKKAQAEVRAVEIHMALEGQSLSRESTNMEIDRIAKEIIERMPSDLWDDE